MSRSQRLLVVLLLNVALVAALVVVGVTAHSLGVLAEGGDYVLDATGVGVALIALALSRRPATGRRPGGYPNALNVAALINAGWLLVLEVLVTLGAVTRLATATPEVHGLPVLVVSGAAAIVMVIGAAVLGGDGDDGDDDLSMKAVLLDTVADAAAAAGVALVGLVIFMTGRWFWLDPAVALVIAVVVGYHALKLVMTIVRRLGATDATELDGPTAPQP